MEDLRFISYDSSVFGWSEDGSLLCVFVRVLLELRVFHNNTFFSNDVYVFAIEDHNAEIVADFFSEVLGHF